MSDALPLSELRKLADDPDTRNPGQRRMELQHQQQLNISEMQNIVRDAHRRDPVGGLQADEQRRFDAHDAATSGWTWATG